jgi:hypothetical protein
MGGAVSAQDAAQQDQFTEFHKQTEISKSLAIKLFPDLKDGTSRLAHDMIMMDAQLKANQSDLYNYPWKPLFLSVVCAQILKITPQWRTLSDAERDEVFHEMSSALLETKDFAFTSNRH